MSPRWFYFLLAAEVITLAIFAIVAIVKVYTGHLTGSVNPSWSWLNPFDIGGLKYRIDRQADGTVRIVDYKTGKAKTQDDADESLQLSIYALAAAQKWGYKASALALQNLEDGSMPVTSRDEIDLREVSERVREVAGEIAEGKFDPKPARHCSWCGFRSLCPATEKNLAVLHNPIPAKH
jgi:RecB family exonuclease